MHRVPGYKVDLQTTAADPDKLTKKLAKANKKPWKNGSSKWNDFVEDLWDDGNLTVEVLEELSKYFGEKNWEDILYYWNLPQDFLRKHRKKIGLANIYRMQAKNLSEKFVEDYASECKETDWFVLSAFADVSEAFIEKHMSDYPWDWSGLCSRSVRLSEAFYDKYADKLDWLALSLHFTQTYSMDFVERHKDDWDWDTIVYDRWNTLTPEFVERFEKEINWMELACRRDLLIRYRGFTEEFFEKNKGKI